jgi:hypothetical protein
VPASYGNCSSESSCSTQQIVLMLQALQPLMLFAGTLTYFETTPFLLIFYYGTSEFLSRISVGVTALAEVVQMLLVVLFCFRLCVPVCVRFVSFLFPPLFYNWNIIFWVDKRRIKRNCNMYHSTLLHIILPFLLLMRLTCNLLFMISKSSKRKNSSSALVYAYYTIRPTSVFFRCS